MSVGKVCTRIVVTARPEETVEIAAQRMAQYDVGTLVIVEEKRPVGIVSDRDLVVRVMAKSAAPHTLTLQGVMSSTLICVPEDMPLEDALSLMRSHQIRRLVVVNTAQELLGIFALDDMLELLGEELHAIAGLTRAAQGWLSAPGTRVSQP